MMYPDGPPGGDRSGEPVVGPIGVDPGTPAEILASTSTWVRLLAILGFVIAGLMALAILGGLAVSGRGRGPAPGMLIFQVPVAVLAIAVSYTLWSFGRAAGRYGLSGRPDDLTEALTRQHAVWRLVAIATLVFLAMSLLFPILILLSSRG
jgi:hypothetical protein